MPQTEVWIWERIATGLTWPRQPKRGTWISAVHSRAVCQEVIPVVSLRGIWPRNLANDRIPAPAILHREFPCLKRHSFLPRDFPGVRQIRGGLVRPKQYTNGPSWQTISWYYPFNKTLTKTNFIISSTVIKVLLLDLQLSLYQRLNLTILVLLEYGYITTQMSYYELYQCTILAMRFLCQRFVSCFSLYMIV
jgi:hypothetical protein